MVIRGTDSLTHSHTNGHSPGTLRAAKSIVFKKTDPRGYRHRRKSIMNYKMEFDHVAK